MREERSFSTGGVVAISLILERWAWVVPASPTTRMYVGIPSVPCCSSDRSWRIRASFFSVFAGAEKRILLPARGVADGKEILTQPRKNELAAVIDKTARRVPYPKKESRCELDGSWYRRIQGGARIGRLPGYSPQTMTLYRRYFLGPGASRSVYYRCLS